MLWVFRNETRPLLGPRSILHMDRDALYLREASPDPSESYNGVTEKLRASGCGTVGLFLKKDAWEYPVWVLMKKGNRSLPYMEAILPDNLSAKFERDEFQPCAIIDNTGAAKITYNGNSYRLYLNYPYLNLLVRE